MTTRDGPPAYRPVRGSRRRAALALAGVAVTLVVYAWMGSDGTGDAGRTRPAVLTRTVTAAPVPSSPTSAGSQVAMGELVRWVAGARAELAQYQLGLHVACGSDNPQQCWAALRYSRTIGADISADLAHVTTRPAEVTRLWNQTSSAALALRTVAERWCGPGRDLSACYSVVGDSTRLLSRALAGWDSSSATP